MPLQPDNLWKHSSFFYSCCPFDKDNSILFLEKSKLLSSSYLKIYFFKKYIFACLLSRFSHARLFATLWTVACQTPLSMGFSGQENWKRLPCPPPGDLIDPGIKPVSVLSVLAAGFFTMCMCICVYIYIYIHTHRQRERERKIHMCVYIYIHTHI